MNAKWHIINHLACAVVFLSVCSFSAFSQERDTIFIIEHDTVWMDLQPDAVIESQTRENRYDRRVHRYRRHWEALIPTHTKIQFAGNMGLLSFGTGWDYGRRNQWETDVFFGVLPKYDSKRTKPDIHRQAELPSLEPANKTEPFFCRTAGLRYVSEHGIRR